MPGRVRIDPQAATAQAVYVSSLHCIDPDCGAGFDLYAASTDQPISYCQFCGGSLMEAAPGWREGQDSGEYPESSETRTVVTFWPRGSGVDTIEAEGRSDLAERVAVANAEGRPTLLRSGRNRVVILSVVELKRVLADTPIRVEAYYDDHASMWILDLLGFDIEESVTTAATMEEATGRLLVSVRRRMRAVLGDVDEPDRRRDIALKLWLLEADGALDSALTSEAVYQPLVPVRGDASRPPADQLIDGAKLFAARKAMKNDLTSKRRALDKLILREQRLFEIGLVDIAFMGSWRNLEDLAQSVRYAAARVDCPEEEAFARFDALLEWILCRAGSQTGRGR